MFGKRRGAENDRRDRDALLANWAEMHHQKELVRKLHQSLRDAILVISGIDPEQRNLFFAEEPMRLEAEILARNNLSYSSLGSLEHRFGRMVYRETPDDGCAVYWRWFGPGADETTILGPIMDADGEMIDYTSRVMQLEERKALING